MGHSYLLHLPQSLHIASGHISVFSATLRSLLFSTLDHLPGPSLFLCVSVTLLGLVFSTPVPPFRLLPVPLWPIFHLFLAAGPCFLAPTTP